MGEQASGGVAAIIRSALCERSAEIFATLEELRERDPARLNILLAALAQELLQLSRQRTGRSSEMLERLARGFAAASTGDTSALRPPPRASER